jgi:hypothetical protein
MHRPFVAAILALCVAMPATAATVDGKKIKKWPELDRVWARSFDAWMTDEDLEFFISLTTTEERKTFLKDAGFWMKWERIERDHKEMVPAIMEGKVVPGMNQDEVYMCWDKPSKIRKDVKKDAYIDVLFYEFERDRKGKEFLLRENSETAYKNEIVKRFVYMDDGIVSKITVMGDGGEIVEAELPKEKPKAKAAPEPTPDAEPTPAAATGGEQTPADPTPAP